MNKKSLEIIEAVVFLLCNFTGFYWFLRLPFTYMERYSPVTASLCLTIITYTFYKFTDNRKIPFTGAALFLLVILSESVIGWKIEYHYTIRKYVRTVGRAMDIPQMLRYTLDPLKAPISSLEALAFALLLTAGYIMVYNIMKNNEQIKELTMRGATQIEIIKTRFMHLRLQASVSGKATLIGIVIIAASNILNSTITPVLPEFLGVTLGLLGAMLMIELIWRIMRRNS